MTSRRRFIQQAAAGVAGLGLSSSAFANILFQNKKQKLGIALMGLGYYSTDLLAPALQLTKFCGLTGIITGTPSKAEAWQKKYNIPDKNIYNYQNFESAANNPDIDVIYVVLPPSMHAEYSIRAAKAGKHVWCEKPMAISVAECQRMIDACNSNKVKLSIGYRMQHEPNTKKLIQMRKDMKYGKVTKVEVKAGYVDNRTDHWKQKKSLGGGVMGDMGVYPLNAARYSTGLEPIAITAKASTTRPQIYKEVEETMAYELEFPGGATASCRASFGENMNDLLVTCSKGWIKYEPFSAYTGVHGETSDGTKIEVVNMNEQAYQMDDDALAIINPEMKPMVPGEEGLKDIRVVEAAYRSVKENKRVVIS
jgi:glucose-fructose oxidoreductase